MDIKKEKTINLEEQIIYQIFPRSFRDSNGDGHGDFQGIIEGLDMIEELGCTMILLNPIQKSPFYHNYFATDFYDIDPVYGSMEDFKNLIEEAHKRNISIILDMEPQYTDESHEIVQKYMQNPDGEMKDLLWKPEEKLAFSGGAAYNGYPFKIYPLHLNNKRIQEELLKVFKFWSDLGVDGFRIDHMMDDLDWNEEQQGLLKNLWEPIFEELSDKIFICEQADWEALQDIIKLFRNTSADAVFSFNIRKSLLTFSKSEIEGAIKKYKYFTPKGKTQLNFLENHDIDRITCVITNEKKQKLLAALMMLLKGAPILYYGQEIGMMGRQGNWGSDGNDIPLRLGYRWTKDIENKHTPNWYKDTGHWSDKIYSESNDGRSLEEQRGIEGSLFEQYKKLIKLRKKYSAILSGDEVILENDNHDLLTFVRKKNEEEILIIVNLSEGYQTYYFDNNCTDIESLRGYSKFSEKVMEPYSYLAVKIN